MNGLGQTPCHLRENLPEPFRGPGLTSALFFRVPRLETFPVNSGVPLRSWELGDHPPKSKGPGTYQTGLFGLEFRKSFVWPR